MLNIPIIKKEQLRCTTLIECEEILYTDIPAISVDEIKDKTKLKIKGYVCKRLNRKEESLAIYFVEMY